MKALLKYRSADDIKQDCYWTHLKIVVEKCQDDGCEREDEEDSKGREGKTDFEEVQDGTEQDGKSMAVQNGQEQSVENVPWNLFRDRLDNTAATQRFMSKRHSTSFEVLTLFFLFLIFWWHERKLKTKEF